MTRLLLASSSKTRARLLAAAGVGFEAMASRVDEDEVKRALLAEGAQPAEIAETLAEMKALRLSAVHPQALVLGCDQVLEFDGRLIDKLPDLAAARRLLCTLRGKSHRLETAAALAREGAIVWRHRECATLTMRNFGEEFVDFYLSCVGEEVLSAVGCYHWEGLGAQLFERVEGDYFAILGLPLLAVLAQLREHGIVGR